MYGLGPCISSSNRMIGMDTRVGGQNLDGSGPSIELYGINARDTRVRSQNLNGPGPDISNLIALDHWNLRATDLELRGAESIITNENTGVGSRSVNNPLNPSLARSSEVSFRGEVDGQNLCGHRSPRSNSVYGGDGLAQGGPQTIPKPIEESFTIDLSQSISQILASLGHKPNANPREGFDVSVACADTWRIASSEWNKKQEDRIMSLEIQLNTVNALWKESQRSLGKIQEEVSKLNSKVLQYEIYIPKLQETVGVLVSMASSLVEEVGKKLEEFQEWVNYVTLKDVTSEIPKEIVDSLHKIILEKTPASTRELVNEPFEHLEGLVRDNGRNTENVRSAIIQLKDRVDNQSINSFDMRDQTVYSLEGSNQGSLKTDTTRRERETFLGKGLRECRSKFAS